MPQDYLTDNLESIKNTYCIRCRMHASLCLCADIQRISTRTQVAIIMHETEQWRILNTGYLATLMLPNSVLRIHGERGRMLDVHDWFEPTHRTFVLFPDTHARVPDPQLAEEDESGHGRCAHQPNIPLQWTIVTS